MAPSQGGEEAESAADNSASGDGCCQDGQCQNEWEVKPWKAVATQLTAAGKGLGWNGLRMLDTAFVDGEGCIEKWIYTSKTGHVQCRRRSDGISKLIDRFSRFALANPENKEGIVALLTKRGDNFRVAVRRSELELPKVSGRSPASFRGGILQCYLRPSQGKNSFFRARRDATGSLQVFSSGPLHRDPLAEMSKDSVRRREELPLGEVWPHAALVGKAMDSLAAFLGGTQPSESLVADLIVDDNNEAWISSVTVVAAHVDKRIRNSGLLPPPPVSLLWEEKGVTFSRKRAAELPGLIAMESWVDPHSQRRSLSANVALASERHRVPSGSVDLLKRMDTLLLDDLGPPPDGQMGAGLASRWKETSDSAAREWELTGRLIASKVHMTVCGNTYEIMERLQALREAGFQPLKGSGQSSEDLAIKKRMRSACGPHTTVFGEKEGVDPHRLADFAHHRREGQASPPPNVTTKKISPAPSQEENGLSAVEANFLKRAMRRASSELGAFAEGYEASPAGAGASQVMEAFRQRLSALGEENALLRKRLEAAHGAAAQEASRASNAISKLTNAQSEFERLLAEKEEAWAIRELAAQERHSRALAAAHAAALEAKSPQAPADGSHPLLLRIASLNECIALQQRKSLEERRAIVAEKNRELSAQQARVSDELREARLHESQLEDNLAALNAQLGEAVAQAASLRARVGAEERRRLAAEEAAESLRQEVSIVRQSIHQVSSLEGESIHSQSSKALGSGSDARIRTLTNKVEYLKGQLASESTLKQELESSLSSVKAKLEAMKEEGRQREGDIEEARRAAVAATQARMQHSLDEQMNEVLRCQTRMQTVQDQLNDALGDVSLAKRREEAAQSEMAGLRDQLFHAEEDLSKMRARVDELSAARLREEEVIANQAANEAMLRRLDNERQYLKSQLESEIICKQELQEALEEAKDDLAADRSEWKLEVDRLREHSQRRIKDLEVQREDLAADKVTLEAELANAKQQAAKVRDGFSKARDRLRMEQATLEGARSTIRQLEDQLHASAAEIKGLEEQLKAGEARHSDLLGGVQATISDMEREKRGSVDDLKRKLAEEIRKTSDAQAAVVRLRAEMARSGHSSLRRLGAQRIFLAAAQMARSRKSAAMRQWAVVHAAVDFRTSLRASADRDLKEAGARARLLQEEALRRAADESARALETALAAAHQDAAQHMAGVRKKLTAERDAEVQRIRAEAKEALAAREKELWQEMNCQLHAHEKEMESSRKASDDALRALAEEHDQKLASAMTLLREQAELLQKEALGAADASWTLKLAALLQEYEAREKKALEVAAAESDAVLVEMQGAFSLERQRWSEESEVLVARAVEQERKVGDERCKASRQQGVEEGRLAAADLGDRMLRARESQWEARAAELERRAVEAAADAQRALFAEKEAWASGKADELKLLEARLSEAQEATVASEARKWEEVLLQAEGRAQGDIAAAHTRGWEERAAEARAEAQQMEQSLQRALGRAQEESKAALAELAAQHEQHVESLERTWIEKQEAAIRDAVLTANDEWDLQAKELMQKACASVRADCRAQAEKDRARAIEAARQRERLHTDKVQEELRDATTRWVREKRELMQAVESAEQAEQKAREDLRRQGVENAAAVAAAEESWRVREARALQEACAEAAASKDRALAELRKTLAVERAKAVKDERTAGEEALEAERERCLEEAQRQASAFDSSLGQVIARAEEAEGEAAKAKEQANKMSIMLQEANELQKRREASHSTTLWQFCISAMREREKLHAEARTEAAHVDALLRHAMEEHKRDRRDLLGDVDELLALHSQFEQNHSTMYETLINHKREVLIDHKVQSASLHKEMEQLGRDRQNVETRHEAQALRLRELEQSAKEIERELQLHSRKSAIGPDGQISAAHQRKKRRLDEELESLLTQMESERVQQASTARQLDQLKEARRDKEDALKELERTLVEVLVEQQKKLLSTLGSMQGQADARSGPLAGIQARRAQYAAAE